MSGKDKVLFELAKANNRKNKKSSTIVIVTIAFAILGISGIFSLTVGKITMDRLEIVRENGTLASGVLMNGTEEQVLKLQELSYINQVGVVKEIGIWQEENLQIAQIVVSDKITFQNFFEPTYIDIIGKYPEQADEIMISQTTLEKIGIDNPQIGMKIPFFLLWNDWALNQKGASLYSVRLSGVFVAHTNMVDEELPVYLSNAFLDKGKKLKHPVNIQFTTVSSMYDRNDIEARIYHDIEIKEGQKIIGINSPTYESWERMIGGYSVAIVSVFVFLVSIFLLVYNIMTISMSSHMFRIGIMRTLGMTRAQLTRMLWVQNIEIIGVGCVIGMLISLPFVYMAAFSWHIYIGVGIFVFIVSVFVVYRTNKSLSAQKRLKKKTTRRKELKIKGKERFYLFHLAWHNVIRIKKRFFLVIISITLGCIMVLCSVVISRGVDIQNQLGQNPDFSVGVSALGMREYSWGEPNMNAFYLIKNQMIKDIEKITKNSKDSIRCVKGGLGYFMEPYGALQLLINTSNKNLKTNTAAVIQGVDDETLKVLEEYARNYDKKIDCQSLISGDGILVLHNHMLSLREEMDAIEQIGKNVYMFDAMSEQEYGLVCSGYLDVTDKHFPQIDMAWNEEYINYFMVSEETFRRMGFEEVAFKISFDVEKGLEIKEELLKYVQEKNNDLSQAFIELVANSDVIEEYVGYLTISRVIMALISITLLLIAFVNYINTLVSGMLAREREFLLMRDIGMERKQIWKVLSYEGLCYSFISIIGILIGGNIIMLLLSNAISWHVSYFTFYYPLKELGGIIVILIVLCVLFPIGMFIKRDKKRSKLS
ncbi:MAG: FtsX-like permease family protein [Lachnospiraceae bacterium]|nr:FtsX-like permease family protein [Lachnospiraceae bacterium]